MEGYYLVLSSHEVTEWRHTIEYISFLKEKKVLQPEHVTLKTWKRDVTLKTLHFIVLQFYNLHNFIVI